ncbi:MAG TPA: hypothetical protein VH268_08950 [Solirubrobacterales bacterium]|jgi:hypothetical protein|nr:hypothetical protein [Solirubrobacterales bacterium]
MGPFDQVLIERNQGHETRAPLLRDIGAAIGRPVVSLFTSFEYDVNINDADADMLEGVLQESDLSAGLALFISSPGGSGLAAERIARICRSYSGTGEYWAIVPGKAKSAATMVCFGASRILMTPTSELGPVDPQLIFRGGGRFSAFNLIQSYEDLFRRAARAKGNLEPYLQQLQKYDARQIREMKAELELAEDISIRALQTGMMKGKSKTQIRKAISRFLTPEQTKTHGRPIYRDEAHKSGLSIEDIDPRQDPWVQCYELYIRTNNYVMTQAAKCIESAAGSYQAAPPSPEEE